MGVEWRFGTGSYHVEYLTQLTIKRKYFSVENTNLRISSNLKSKETAAELINWFYRLRVARFEWQFWIVTTNTFVRLCNCYWCTAITIPWDWYFPSVVSVFKSVLSISSWLIFYLWWRHKNISDMTFSRRTAEFRRVFLLLPNSINFLKKSSLAKSIPLDP